jgi:hypothetical protein
LTLEWSERFDSAAQLATDTSGFDSGAADSSAESAGLFFVFAALIWLRFSNA